MTLKYLKNLWKYDPTKIKYDIMKFALKKNVLYYSLNNTFFVPSEYTIYH